MTFRVIGPWRKGEEWFVGGKPQPPNAILLPLWSWEDKRSSMLSTTLPLQLWRMSSKVPLLWWGNNLPSSSMGGCLRDRALISFDSLGYLNSWDLSWRFSSRYLLFVLRMLSTECSGDFLTSGELPWWSFSACSRGSAFTCRSGERAILLGLVLSSSSSSETELHLFRDSANDSQKALWMANKSTPVIMSLFSSLLRDTRKEAPQLAIYKRGREVEQGSILASVLWLERDLSRRARGLSPKPWPCCLLKSAKKFYWFLSLALMFRNIYLTMALFLLSLVQCGSFLHEGAYDKSDDDDYLEILGKYNNVIVRTKS